MKDILKKTDETNEIGRNPSLTKIQEYIGTVQRKRRAELKDFKKKDFHRFNNSQEKESIDDLYTEAVVVQDEIKEEYEMPKTYSSVQTVIMSSSVEDILTERAMVHAFLEGDYYDFNRQERIPYNEKDQSDVHRNTLLILSDTLQVENNREAVIAALKNQNIDYNEYKITL